MGETSDYRWHDDPGHGWLEVSELELRDLGIADEITAYSYRREGRVYLEEDQDAGTFLRAWEARHGREWPREAIPSTSHAGSAPCRGFARWEG